MRLNTGEKKRRKNAAAEIIKTIYSERLKIDKIMCIHLSVNTQRAPV